MRSVQVPGTKVPFRRAGEPKSGKSVKRSGVAPAWDADVLLVGGTCADVAGGNATGVPVLAVATGRTSRTDLDKAGATTTAPGLLAQAVPADSTDEGRTTG
ncbi:HAD hydrolase-like protein [Streptomyces anulatus]|uniref:HAD hydrolase-like protein n=1 Tax=Streptomyces anulatus TaxID=1892 RepID=UPI00368DABB7